MRVELNIGLNIKGGANSAARMSERAAVALRLLSNRFTSVQHRTQCVRHMGADGKTPTVESTLVVAVDVDVDAMVSLVAAAMGVSITLGQDCVAVRYNDNKGRLIGPRASAWGEFNPEYFIRF